MSWQNGLTKETMYTNSSCLRETLSKVCSTGEVGIADQSNTTIA